MIKMFYKASAILAFVMLCTSVKRRPNFERVFILNLLNFIYAQAILTVVYYRPCGWIVLVFQSAGNKFYLMKKCLSVTVALRGETQSESNNLWKFCE